MKNVFLGLALVAGITNGKPKTDDPNYSACNETNITWGVSYIGHSSKFTFYECDDSSNSLSTTMNSIMETDSNGNSVNSNKVVSFATSQNAWEWNTQTYTNYTKDNETYYDSAVCNTYNATLAVGNGQSTVGVPYLFTSCILFTNRTEEVCPEPPLEGDCETYVIEANNLKWSVYFGSWPFAATSNKITLTVSIQQDNAAGDFNDSSSTSALYKATMGNFDFVAPKTATVTNSSGSFSENVDVDCAAGSGNNQVTCKFTFNYFSGSLTYDPSVDGSDSGSSSSAINFISLSLINYLFIFIYYIFC